MIIIITLDWSFIYFIEKVHRCLKIRLTYLLTIIVFVFLRCKQNDMRELMKKIEEGLHNIHAQVRTWLIFGHRQTHTLCHQHTRTHITCVHSHHTCTNLCWITLHLQAREGAGLENDAQPARQPALPEAFARVLVICQGSPAAEAGIKQDDLIARLEENLRFRRVRSVQFKGLSMLLFKGFFSYTFHLFNASPYNDGFLIYHR